MVEVDKRGEGGGEGGAGVVFFSSLFFFKKMIFSRLFMKSCKIKNKHEKKRTIEIPVKSF